MRTYDLNADVGEGFPYDAELMAVITSANVACGFHAGDAQTMRSSCDLAVEHGVCVGAQVSYRDREGFGRRDVEVDVETLFDDLVEQIADLRSAAAAAGAEVRYVKPHGALYNRAGWDPLQAGAVVRAARESGLPVLGLPGAVLVELAALSAVDSYREFFADRAYDARGRLVSRAVQGSVIDDVHQVERRIALLVEDGVVIADNGEEVAVEADSICVHGDTPGAAGLARGVRSALESLRIGVAAFA